MLVGPVPHAVFLECTGLADSWRDQGSVMAFSQLPGSFLNDRLGALLEQNQPEIIFVKGVKIWMVRTIKSGLRHTGFVSVTV